MNVLLDTSVWIRGLSGQQPYAQGLGKLLARRAVRGHALVYGELLIGDRGGRAGLLRDFERMHQAPTVAHGEVVTLVRRRALHGRGIGWVDAHLLASALAAGLELWTADLALATIAEGFGINHRP
ncbi:MAG: PIN domain-containing protein [Terriglobales bacterium]